VLFVFQHLLYNAYPNVNKNENGDRLLSTGVIKKAACPPFGLLQEKGAVPFFKCRVGSPHADRLGNGPYMGQILLPFLAFL
jgi:hypothetical protein